MLAAVRQVIMARSYDSSAAAYFAAMAVQEPASVKRLVSDFVTGLKADGSWSLIDRIILPMGTEQASLRDLKQPTKTATNQNGCTFTAYRGFTGDAVSKYIDFGEALGAAGNNYTVNAASIFAYCNFASATAGSQPHIGAAVNSNSKISPNNAASTTLQINSGGTAIACGVDRRGNRLGIRDNSATDELYFNSAFILEPAQVSGTLAGGNAAGLRSTSGSYSDDRVGSVGYGAITSAQAISFQQRLHVLMTGLGANY